MTPEEKEVIQKFKKWASYVQKMSPQDVKWIMNYIDGCTDGWNAHLGFRYKPENAYLIESPIKATKENLVEDISSVLANEFWRITKQNNPNAKQPNLKNWADDFRLILGVDNRPLVQVQQVLKTLEANNGWFWNKQILSPGAMRKTTRSGADKFTVIINSMREHNESINKMSKKHPGTDAYWEEEENKKKALELFADLDGDK